MSDFEMAVVEKKNNKILREIELEIRKGQMVAIIGEYLFPPLDAPIPPAPPLNIHIMI